MDEFQAKWCKAQGARHKEGRESAKARKEKINHRGTEVTEKIKIFNRRPTQTSAD
jgi:hypothetical protein